MTTKKPVKRDGRSRPRKKKSADPLLKYAYEISSIFEAMQTELLVTTQECLDRIHEAQRHFARQVSKVEGPR